MNWSDVQHEAFGWVVHRREAHIGPEVDMRESLQQRSSSAFGHPGDPVDYQVFG